MRRPRGSGRGRAGGRQGQGIRRSGPDRPSGAADREADSGQLYGQRSERSARLLDQMELQLRGAGEQRPRRTRSPPRWRRPGPRRGRPSPASGQRASRSPSTCRASGWSSRHPTACRVLRRRRGCPSWARTSPRRWRSVPRQWKVIQHVREKFTCRDCESISQAPAPFHVTPRGWAGPEPAGDDPVREVRPASAA